MQPPKKEAPTVNRDGLRYFLLAWAPSSDVSRVGELMAALDPLFRIAEKNRPWPNTYSVSDRLKDDARLAASAVATEEVQRVLFFNRLSLTPYPEWLAAEAKDRWQAETQAAQWECFWASIGTPYQQQLQHALAVIVGDRRKPTKAEEIGMPDGYNEIAAREALVITRKTACREALWQCLGAKLYEGFFNERLWPLVWEPILCYATAVAAGRGDLGATFFKRTVCLLPQAVIVGARKNYVGDYLAVSAWNEKAPPSLLLLPARST
ncbi:MAG: hypothetical protein PHT12_06025 [Patescibacteria group bacterium]|nr:hypothetical protein [Patescibacteria group bacterium]